MIDFAFKTCYEAQTLCEAIVSEMVRLFGISEEEATARVNRQWGHLELTDPQDIVFHEDEEFWAKDIYFGHDSAWWIDESAARPVPFPGADDGQKIEAREPPEPSRGPGDGS